MKVGTFLKELGGATATVKPNELIRSVLQSFREHNTGAVIVCDGETSLDAILTEHDIIRGLAAHGPEALNLPASALATTAGATCSTNDSMTDVAKLMSFRRLTHLPVVNGGRITAVIDIFNLLEERLADRRRVTRALMASMPMH